MSNFITTNKKDSTDGELPSPIQFDDQYGRQRNSTTRGINDELRLIDGKEDGDEEISSE